MPPQRFLHKAATLFSGTVAAYLIGLAALPALSRLYGPADFGVYQVFLSLLGMGMMVAALRYDAAILSPEDDRQAGRLTVLSLAIAGVFTTILLACTAALWLWPGAAQRLHWIPAVGPGPHGAALFLLLLTASFFAIGVLQILKYWGLRRQQVRAVTQAKVLQAGGQSGVALLAGAAALGPAGLLLGDVAGRLGALAFLAGKTSKELGGAIAGLRAAEVRETAGRFRRFPQLGFPSALLNTSTLALTPLVLFYGFGPAVAGFYALADRVVGLPSLFIAQSMAQAYMAEASMRRHQAAGGARALLVKLVLSMAAASLAPFLVLVLAGPWLFSVVLGATWLEAGQFARVLAIVYLVSFVATPVSPTLLIFERQGLQLAWDAGRFAAIAAAWVLALYFGVSALSALLLYALINAAAYLVLLALCLHATATVPGETAAQARASAATQ